MQQAGLIISFLEATQENQFTFFYIKVLPDLIPAVQCKCKIKMVR